MANILTSSSLIESVKRRGLIPSSQSTFTDDDFLAIANEELTIGLVPSILEVFEEFYVKAEEVPIVASTAEYPIPYRAIGGKLRDLMFKDDNGNVREMTRIPPENLPYFQSVATTSIYNVFYVRGNSIILVPEVSATPVGRLLMTYYIRPNKLVKESRIAIITGIDFNSGDITVDKVPANIKSGSLVDFLEVKSGHKTKAFDKTTSGVSSTSKTISFSPADIPKDLLIGDHIATAEECMIPQCPSDLHGVLAQRATARILDALGDAAGLASANAKLQEMESKTFDLIDNRVVGAVQKINPLRSLLRTGKLRARRRI